MTRMVYIALLTACALAFGATRVGGHTRDWRDGLPGSIELGAASVAQPTAASDSSIASAESRLTADLRSKAGDANARAAAIRDTVVLIGALRSASLTEQRRHAELGQALAVARESACAHCASLLAAALGP